MEEIIVRGWVMTKLFTQKDLAERWQVSVRAIENWRKEGIVTPAKGVPAIRFTEQHILELEGVKLDKLSPLERRRLEKEVEELTILNEKMKEILSKVMSLVAQVYV